MTKLKRIKLLFFENRIKILILLIIIFAAFLRFYNYDNRFGIAADQARDVLIVRQALRDHTLPLVGPFSAAGSFVFGPYWYWFFVIPVALFPHYLLAPWIFQSILYVLIIPITYLAGKKIINYKFGLLLAFFTAISAKEITLSTNLIISALVGFFAFVIFYFFIKFLKEKKSVDIYIISFLISLSINTHFEAVPLIFLIPMALVYSKQKAKDIVFSIIFFIIPFAPLFIFNLNSNFYESSNILNLHNQAPNGRTIVQVLKPWFDFGFTFIPRVWRDVLGSNAIIANLFIILSILLNLIMLIKRKMPKEILGIFFSFVLMLAFLLLYKGRLFENFLSFIFPFILFISAWTCFILFKKNKFAGTFVIIIISLFTLISNFSQINNAVNNTSTITNYFKNALIKNYPNTKFSLYNYNNINTDIAYSLSLYLDMEGKISDQGMRIGFANVGAPVNHQIIINNKALGLTIYTLHGTSNKEINKENFKPVNANNIYNQVENWYKH